MTGSSNAQSVVLSSSAIRASHASKLSEDLQLMSIILRCRQLLLQRLHFTHDLLPIFDIGVLSHPCCHCCQNENAVAIMVKFALQGAESLPRNMASASDRSYWHAGMHPHTGVTFLTCTLSTHRPTSCVLDPFHLLLIVQKHLPCMTVHLDTWP